MARSASLPSGFRISSSGPVIPLTRPQYRHLVYYLSEQRKKGRPVYLLQIITETGIEQAQARICELRRLGFNILTLNQENPCKGDRRKLYILAESILLVWPKEGSGDGN